MNDYTIKYINLFYEKKRPDMKVFDVLIDMGNRFITLNVKVLFKSKEGKHPWHIMGNSSFEHLTKDELDEFIGKMKTAETYYMSGDDYEIVGVIPNRDKNNNSISVAISHDEGHFSTVRLPNVNMNDIIVPSSNYKYYTRWDYLTPDKLTEFIDKVNEFIKNNKNYD